MRPSPPKVKNGHQACLHKYRRTQWQRPRSRHTPLARGALAKDRTSAPQQEGPRRPRKTKAEFRSLVLMLGLPQSCAGGPPHAIQREELPQPSATTLAPCKIRWWVSPQSSPFYRTLPSWSTAGFTGGTLGQESGGWQVRQLYFLPYKSHQPHPSSVSQSSLVLNARQRPPCHRLRDRKIPPGPL